MTEWLWGEGGFATLMTVVECAGRGVVLVAGAPSANDGDGGVVTTEQERNEGANVWNKAGHGSRKNCAFI